MKSIIGNRYGRLTVLELDGRMPDGKRIKYKCKCDCGNISGTSASQLSSGKTRSCGCLNRELAAERMRKVQMTTHTHDMTNTRLFRLWVSMKIRCYNPVTNGYKNYGGRGISVCDRWMIFKNFYEDMTESYVEHCEKYGEMDTTLDRINVDGNYEPSNCRWLTKKKQARNKRGTKRYVVKGENLCPAEIAEKYNIRCDTFLKRIKRGWPPEEAALKPVIGSA